MIDYIKSIIDEWIAKSFIILMVLMAGIVDNNGKEVQDDSK